MPKAFAYPGKLFTYGELSRPKLEFSVLGKERDKPYENRIERA
jgi:hypothetical protein